MMGKITVLGMGPGDFGLISLAAWETMLEAKTLVLRTAVHPTAEALSKRGVTFTSYDELYEAASDFASLYESIADDLVRRATNGEEIVYAVPGSPLVAERTVVLLREKADVPLIILPGMSFVEVLCERLGLDPIDGLTIIDAADIDRVPMDWPTGLVVTQVYSVAVASETKLALMELLPDTYEIVMSNLGVRILYGVLNEQPWLWCERVFAPWTDMEQEMRQAGLPLFALESGDPVRDFDIFAF